MGRRRKMTDSQRSEVVVLLSEGKSISHVARKYNVSRTTIYNVLKERETSVEQLISDRSYSCGDCRYWRQTDHTPLGVGAGICRRFRRHEENALEDEPFIHTEGHMKINFATPKEFGCVLGKTREPKTTDVETQVSVPEQ